MTYEEAMKLSSELMGRINSLSQEDNRTIEKLYKESLKKEVRKCNCKDKHRDALIETFTYLKRNKKMKEKSKFVLKPGAVIQVFGNPRVYTNENLTDDIAKEYLTNNPGLRTMFSVIPDEFYESKSRKGASKED